MSKVWLIVEQHFRQEVLTRSFLIVLFSMPLFLSFTIGLGYLTTRLERKSTTLGYVDQAGLVVSTQVPSGRDEVKLLPLQTREAAQAALEAGQIAAYYVLPADYRQSHKAELVYFQAPPYSATSYFSDVVRRNLLAGQSPAVVERMLSGASVTVRAIKSNRYYPDGGPGAGQFLPLLASAIFAFLVLTTSGYMMEVLVREKENRTVEVIFTSVSPGQMLAGKIIGTVGIALLQLTVWAVFLVGAVWLGSHVLAISWLQNVHLNWRDLLLILAVILPTYLFIAALMTMIGTTLVESQEVQQVGPLLFLLLLLPIYLVIPLIQNPNNPLAMGMSLFPITSVMTLAMRSILWEVPLWQFALAAAIALACGLITIWLAGKAFRVGMLRYGQRLSWRDLLGGLERGRHE
jgi:ABC-2 type transport system permease protein